MIDKFKEGFNSIDALNALVDRANQKRLSPKTVATYPGLWIKITGGTGGNYNFVEVIEWEGFREVVDEDARGKDGELAQEVNGIAGLESGLIVYALQDVTGKLNFYAPGAGDSGGGEQPIITPGLVGGGLPAGTYAGDLLCWDAAGFWRLLHRGKVGQILTSTATGLAWVDPPCGSHPGTGTAPGGGTTPPADIYTIGFRYDSNSKSESNLGTYGKLDISAAPPFDFEFGIDWGGTATPGENADYIKGESVYTWKAGATSFSSVNFSIREDDLPEQDETVILTLKKTAATPANILIDPAANVYTHTIKNDD